jgi:hypothetical protein
LRWTDCAVRRACLLARRGRLGGSSRCNLGGGLWLCFGWRGRLGLCEGICARRAGQNVVLWWWDTRAHGKNGYALICSFPLSALAFYFLPYFLLSRPPFRLFSHALLPCLLLLRPLLLLFLRWCLCAIYVFGSSFCE